MWRRHFAKLLNIQSEFDEKLQKARQRPLRPKMSALPSEEDIWGAWGAIGKLKSGKAGGDSGILHEMVKEASCEEGFFHLLMDLVHAAWCECRAPKEWSDAVLVPIQKKGNLGKCDNWRGISVCEVCSRRFRRGSDKKRHKCMSEREKPVCEQHGATQCTVCSRWFGSRGGLPVHTCRPRTENWRIGV